MVSISVTREMKAGSVAVRFESMCLRGLAVYGDAIGALLSHYRDNSDLEVDAILSKPSGAWAGIEIKWDGGAADQAARRYLDSATSWLLAAKGLPNSWLLLWGLASSLTPEMMV